MCYINVHSDDWTLFFDLDRKYLEVAETAFNLLFKPHFVFIVQYADELQNFYDLRLHEHVKLMYLTLTLTHS